MKSTENYELKKPDYNDGVDIGIINENMDKIDEALKVQDDAIQNIDVKSDVEEVINRRVNTDRSNPLNVIIGLSKDAVLNAISTLTGHVTTKATEIINHVTNQHTATKTHITSARDNTNNHVTAQHTDTKNTVNAARDNVKSHVTAEKNSLVGLVDSNKLVPSNTLKHTLYSHPSGIEHIYLGTIHIKYNGTIRITCDAYRVATHVNPRLMISSTYNYDFSTSNYPISFPAPGASLSTYNFGSGRVMELKPAPAINTWATHEYMINVHRGETLAIFSGGFSTECQLKNVKVYYDEVTI